MKLQNRICPQCKRELYQLKSDPAPNIWYGCICKPDIPEFQQYKRYSLPDEPRFIPYESWGEDSDNNF